MANDDVKELLKSMLASNEELKIEIKQSRAQLAAEIRELKDKIHSEIQELKVENEDLKEEVSKLKEKIVKIEHEAKKYKLMIYGLEETGDDRIDVTTCIDLLKQKLNIDCQFIDFRNISRVGRPITGRKRPISIETSSYFLQSDILKNAKNLKGSNIFISPEYPREEYEERKALGQHLKEARQNNKVAQISNKKLIIDGKEYTLTDLEKIKWQKGSVSKQKEEPHSSRRKPSQSDVEDEENRIRRVTRNQVRDQINKN
nr:unnamed protein product [Callosobruchus analis]CAI5856004.1 unnamed protein product [Callosobruchus analis]